MGRAGNTDTAVQVAAIGLVVVLLIGFGVRFIAFCYWSGREQATLTLSAAPDDGGDGGGGGRKQRRTKRGGFQRVSTDVEDGIDGPSPSYASRAKPVHTIGSDDGSDDDGGGGGRAGSGSGSGSGTRMRYVTGGEDGMEIEGEIDDEIAPDDSISMAWMKSAPPPAARRDATARRAAAAANAAAGSAASAAERAAAVGGAAAGAPAGAPGSDVPKLPPPSSAKCVEPPRAPVRAPVRGPTAGGGGEDEFTMVALRQQPPSRRKRP